MLAAERNNRRTDVMSRQPIDRYFNNPRDLSMFNVQIHYPSKRHPFGAMHAGRHAAPQSASLDLRPLGDRQERHVGSSIN